MSGDIIREYFGVFDGENMVDNESGKIHTVPGNYASKSMLVEGDKLRMIVTESGVFFKQIAPVDRKKILTKMVSDTSGHLVAMDRAMRTYRIIEASISFYGLQEGDEIIIVVPKEDSRTLWGAVFQLL